ncbi:MAG: aminopeptidase P family protein [Salinarimonadaceae bacterium]|nr:MAG: aminopeptidase P family protein [Salinarimonadaceae bacterium]
MSGPFQTFDDTSAGGPRTARLDALRDEIKKRGAHGFVVPRADEHQCEYAPACAERLAWLTGFTGSAGTAVVLAEAAALFTDGRYTLQAPMQVDVSDFEIVNIAETRLADWIARRLPAGAKLGFDPWLHTAEETERLRVAVRKAGGDLVAFDDNPVDAIWTDRPAPPSAPVVTHPEEFAGESAQDKLARIREALACAGCDALVVSDPHNLAWAFNIRGGDVSHTPITLGYALLPSEGRPTLFLAGEKVAGEAARHLEALADRAEPSALAQALATLGQSGARVRVDRATGAEALRALVADAGGEADVGDDPVTLMKAVKNAVEIEGARAAHRRDGVAVARFLAWFDREAPAGALTEIDAVEALERRRAETNALADISFPTISGAGPNGAIVHYRVSRATNRRIAPGELFLIDSGGQYRDGTTDITRTLVVGDPTPQMRDRYTRVLRGHIAISRAVFPKGVTGAQIDAFARAPLWEAGLDYDHGTGHGVGSFLSVHEGPQRIAKLGHTALEPGMILSNEPGYYKTGAYGIRIENLIIVEEREIPGAERSMRGFETLTLAPYDARLIDKSLLTPEEIMWIDAYHARVFEEISPALDEGTRDWLTKATAPL